MRRRGYGTAAVLAVAVWLLLVLAAAPTVVRAQEAPPDDPPAPVGWAPPDLGALGRETAGAIFAQAGTWIEEWLKGKGLLVLLQAFLSAVGWIGQRLLGGLVDADGATGLLTRLDLDLTLGNPTVRDVWHAARGLFNVIVGAGAVAVGFLVLLRFGGVVAAEVGELLPRAALGFLLVNGSLDLLRFLGTVANDGAAYLVGGRADDFGRMALEQLPPSEAGATLLVVAVMAGLLFIQRLLMHGVLDLLAMTAPLAFAAWVVPMWSGWFWRWASLLGSLLVGAVLQAMLLAAGTGMLTWAVTGGWGTDGTRLLSGAVAAAVLLLAVLAPGLVGAGLVGGTMYGAARGLARRLPGPAGRLARRASGGDEEEEEVTGPKEHIYEAGRRGQLPQRGGSPPMVVLTRLPSLPPAITVSTRPALPPPDYLKD
jgi:hypothetical protein